MINYTTPEEILTFLPKEIRQSESREDLISYIIRGYRRLKIPQDKDVRQQVLSTTTNTNIEIPDNYKQIISVQYIYPTDCHTNNCYETKTIYYDGLHSDLCGDKNKCTGNCQLTYSIRDRVLTLPHQGEYLVTYNQLYSDNLLIFDDETLKEYLASWATYQVSYNRARTSDVQSNLLQFDFNIMNALYTKARGEAIMRTIQLANYQLDNKQLNLNYDEFNNRYFSAQPTS